MVWSDAYRRNGLSAHLEGLKKWEEEASGKLETAQEATKQKELVKNIKGARTFTEKLIESADEELAALGME